MNIAIHAGHAVIGSRGATGVMDEVKKNRLLKKEIIKYLKRQKDVTVIDTSVHSGTQYGVLKGIVSNFRKKSKGKGKKWINISIHLNSSNNTNANGFEMFVPDSFISNKRKRTALESMCEEICKKTGFNNRGVKKGNGLYVCRNLPNCILLEVGFVTSNKDKSVYENTHSKKIACIIADCILKYGKEVVGDVVVR